MDACDSRTDAQDCGIGDTRRLRNAENDTETTCDCSFAMECSSTLDLNVGYAHVTVSYSMLTFNTGFRTTRSNCDTISTVLFTIAIRPGTDCVTNLPVSDIISSSSCEDKSALRTMDILLSRSSSKYG